MKASHRRILKWLRDGARIWAPSGACSGAKLMAFVCLPNGHPDGDMVKVRVATMKAMTDAGLVQNMFGVWNAGDEYADNIWALPGASDE